MTPSRRADVAFWIAILAGVLFIAFLGPLGRRLEMVHSNDFSGFWSGPRSVLVGVSPWDPQRYAPTAVAIDTKTPDALVDDYMPHVVLALLPLGLLPLEVAAWVWMVASMACSATALRALLRTFLPGRTVSHAALGLALFVGQPGFHTLVLGQWALLLMSALTVVVLALRAGHVRRAGLAALAFLAKPQLFVWTAVGLALPAIRDVRYRRFVTYALVLAGALVLFAWLAYPDWFPAWLADIPARRTGRSAVLFSAPDDLILPFLATLTFRAGPVAVGVLLAAASAGLLAGLPLVGPAGRRLGTTGAIVAGFALMATGNLLTAAAPWLMAAFAAQGDEAVHRRERPLRRRCRGRYRRDHRRVFHQHCRPAPRAMAVLARASATAQREAADRGFAE